MKTDLSSVHGSILRRLLYTIPAACLMAAMPAAAQSVSVGQLGAAQSFDRGPLTAGSGGLDANLWQGVSASRAAAQIDAIDIDGASELSYRFIRRILLSAGVPPQGDSETEAAYLQATTQAKLALGDYAALDSVSNEQNPLLRDPKFRANLALSTGDVDGACEESDREIDNRSAPFWMQIRIVCHIKREETAAAELTLNFMRENEESDKDFIALADYVLGLKKTTSTKLPSGQPVFTALKALKGGVTSAKTPADYAKTALSSEGTPNGRLAALFKSGRSLRPEQVKSIMSELQFSDADLAGEGGSYDLDTALEGLKSAVTRTKSVAQLYALANNLSDPTSSSHAVAALLNFSEGVGFVPQMTDLLSDSLPFIPADRQAELDAPRFAWAAVRRSDLSALGGIYRSLEAEDPLAGRIALASDALGNGFLLGQLGLDIEERLTKNGTIRRQAIRDALIALALGAQLSDAAAETLETYTQSERINPIQLARLNAAANANARAGTLLYVTQAIGARDVRKLSNLEIYTYVAALSKAGLTREAGELAAFDFLSRIPAS